MKQVLLFLILSMTFQITYSQTPDLDLDVIKIKKNTIWLEAYQPIHTNSSRSIDNENILNRGLDRYEKTAHHYGLGIAYERMFKNNLVLRSRFGISEIFVIENTFDESSFDGFEGNEVQIEDSAYDYEQRHFNVFLGIAKKINVGKNFNVDIGVECAGIYYEAGKGTYLQKAEARTNFSRARSRVEFYSDYGKFRNIGLGPILKPEFVLPMGLSFSVEFQLFFMKTTSNDDVTFETTSETIYTQNGIEQTYSNESFEESEQVISEWNWSELSPLVRVGYRF